MTTTLSLLLFLLLTLASTLPTTTADPQQRENTNPSSSSSSPPAPILPPGHLQMFSLVNNLDVPVQATMVYNYTEVYRDGRMKGGKEEGCAIGRKSKH